MPEEEDSITDSLAAAQEANTLLNRVRREDPDLWQKILLLPNGLRAAMTAESHHNEGKNITLVANETTKRGYVVVSELVPQELTHAEVMRQLKCEFDTPAVPLPGDTNVRVSAAAAALSATLARLTSLEPRSRDDRVTRYINEQIGRLRQAQLGEQPDPNTLRRLETVRRAFNEELPNSITKRLRELIRAGSEGIEFIQEITRMMEELPKTEETGVTTQRRFTQSRILCSMGTIRAK